MTRDKHFRRVWQHRLCLLPFIKPKILLPKFCIGSRFFLSVLKIRQKNVRCKVKEDIRRTAKTGVSCTRLKTVEIKVEKRQFSAL